MQPSVQYYSCYKARKTKVHTWCSYCHFCINSPMWREKRWLQGIFDPPSQFYGGKRRRVFALFKSIFLRNRSLSNARWFCGKKRKIGKGNLYLTENRLSKNEMWRASDNHNNMRHTCAKDLLDSNFIQAVIKGALDKYDIYLFISNSTENFKLNQCRNFQLIQPMRFHFIKYFVNSLISRVSHRLLYCVFIEVDFEK